MPIKIKCTCGKTLQVPDEYAGQEGECPNCKKPVHIPAAEEAGQITRNVPPPLPKKAKKAESAPWLDPPRKPLPKDEEDEEELALTTHSGGFVDDDDDLFEDAPKEIGRLISVFTSLKRDQEPKPILLRVTLTLGAFFVSFFMIGCGFAFFQGNQLRGEGLLLAFVLALAAGSALAGFAFWWTHFSHTCSYVGTKGVAVFKCSGSRENVKEIGFFLFKNATELRISQTRHYYNGVYTGTDYSFVWTDEDSKTVYQFGGRYRSEAGTPGPADPYHFALAAEDAWTRHLYRDLDRAIEADGSVFFGLRGGDFVKLGDGLLILAQGGKKIKLRANQIEKMNIGNGVISIWENGAKEGWFVNSGIHQFMYADLGNARFFLFALEKLVGIRF